MHRYFYRRDVSIYDSVRVLKSIARGKARPLVTAVALSEYLDVFLTLYVNRCPFCLRKMKRRSSIWKHIRSKPKCLQTAYAVAVDIMYKYREFRKRVKIMRAYGKTKYLVCGVGWFYDPIEAYEKYKQHVDCL
jgi:hypothetical protein